VQRQASHVGTATTMLMDCHAVMLDRSDFSAFCAKHSSFAVSAIRMDCASHIRMSMTYLLVQAQLW
jgi:hypothetical protein